MRSVVGEIFNFILVLCVLGFAVCTCGLFAGPYDIEFKRLYLCDDLANYTVPMSTKMYKINRTHMLYKDIQTFPGGLHDLITVTIEVSIFGNGGWKRNFLNIKLVRGCTDTTRLVPGFLETFFGSAGYNFTGCPIPPGTYHLNWIFKLEFAMKTLPYNKCKFTVTYTEKEKIHNCFILEANIVPKRGEKSDQG